MTTTIDHTTPEGARALESLAGDKTGWLTTIDAAGQPQSSPIWFLWGDGEILIYSNRRARRNAHVGDRPLVSFNLNTDASGDQLVTMEGVARIDPEGVSASDNPAYLAKYQRHIEAYGWTVDWFATEYPVVLRVTPTRWRVG